MEYSLSAFAADFNQFLALLNGPPQNKIQARLKKQTMEILAGRLRNDDA
jgi:hypothetical protein